MRLPENLRDQLKTPLGTLILENETTKENILKQILKPSKDEQCTCIHMHQFLDRLWTKGIPHLD